MSVLVQERWHQKLTNWAIWVCSGSRTGSAGVSSVYRGMVRVDFDRSPRSQALIGAAHDVDALIHRLSHEHQRAVVAYFVWTGSLQSRARALGIGGDTLNRVKAACYRLDDLFHANRPRRTASERLSETSG